jgi:hypothetical protein
MEEIKPSYILRDEKAFIFLGKPPMFRSGVDITG